MPSSSTVTSVTDLPVFAVSEANTGGLHPCGWLIYTAAPVAYGAIAAPASARANRAPASRPSSTVDSRSARLPAKSRQPRSSATIVVPRLITCRRKTAQLRHAAIRRVVVVMVLKEGAGVLHAAGKPERHPVGAADRIGVSMKRRGGGELRLCQRATVERRQHCQHVHRAEARSVHRQADSNRHRPVFVWQDVDTYAAVMSADRVHTLLVSR